MIPNLEVKDSVVVAYFKQEVGELAAEKVMLLAHIEYMNEQNKYLVEELGRARRELRLAQEAICPPVAPKARRKSVPSRSNIPIGDGSVR
jgi:hypothetical protein